jgi:hypothetical protein
MAIYWRRDDIPALQGLSSTEKKAAIRSVIWPVWRHWQVWSPFLLLFAGYAAFFLLAPRFPYRSVIVSVSVLVFARLAVLPFHSYLQHHLSAQR